ncbi:hypothetical protein ACFE04_031287 [Oxalis oulophora]
MDESISIQHFQSFTPTPNISTTSVNHDMSSTSSSGPTQPCLDILSLNKLSSHLDHLLSGNSLDYTDAVIVVDDVSVGVHRCILAARSRFFDELFKRKIESVEKKEEGKVSYCLSEFLPYVRVSYEAFSVLLGYFYTARLKPFPVEASTCIDSECIHEACRPAVDLAVELMYASTIFQVPELVSLFQRHLLHFVEKARIENVIPILTAAFHCQLEQLLSVCVEKVARSDLDSTSIRKELPHEVSEQIRSLRCNPIPQNEQEKVTMATEPLQEKRIRSIHQALDLDDIELVKLLSHEYCITLDDANSLHYTVAYCDPKVVFDVLGLNLADVNLRNGRGYTVLHIAAMRREPSVIMSLLKKGARVSELTPDGRTAISICRSLTRPKDYNEKVSRGEKTNKKRICVDILEKGMQINPVGQNVQDNSQEIAEDQYMKLLNVENRVALAGLFFPTEAKLAMDIAHAETNFEFTFAFKEVNLNETPDAKNLRIRSRLEVLLKTVETGRRFFPHCSEVLDKFIGDDLPDLLYLDKGTPNEKQIKRKRYMELKEDFQNAFTKDKAEYDRRILSSSSSSSSKRCSVKNYRLKNTVK